MFLDIFENGFFVTLFSLPFFIVPIMFVVVPVVFIVFIVKSVKRARNSGTVENGTFKSTISNANNPEDYWNSISGENVNHQCEYCGTEVHNVLKKCPSCGAKLEK